MFPQVQQINPFGWFHLIYFGLFVPALVLSQVRKVRDLNQPLPNRLSHFRRTAFGLVASGIISILVARLEGLQLLPAAFPSWPGVLAGLIMLAVAIILMRPRWRRAVEKRMRVVYLFMPSTLSERLGWICVAILAGISEEITWRGVQAALVANLTRSIWWAVLICSVSFAVGHATQGWKSVPVIGLFAVAFHLLVWLSGSLYVAMMVHIAYDLVAGISYGRLGKELGYELPTAEPPLTV